VAPSAGEFAYEVGLPAKSGVGGGAGEFAYEVGLPAKSGVGGAIAAIVPGKMSLCAWSPALGDSGNSVAATEALRLFAEQGNCSVF